MVMVVVAVAVAVMAQVVLVRPPRRPVSAVLMITMAMAH